MSELNLILIGPPGAGKGTQADQLRRDFGLAYISTGDMLRANVKAGTDLGKAAKKRMDTGELVPDDLIVAMAADRLRQEMRATASSSTVFPAPPHRPRRLDEHLGGEGRRVTAALLLDVPDEEVVKRISGRRVCTEAGHNFHVDFDPPKVEGICDEDGSQLVQRDDDNPDVVRNRLRVFHEQTFPLVEFYENRGLLRRIDGTGSAASVHDHLRAVIATLKLEDGV